MGQATILVYVSRGLARVQVPNIIGDTILEATEKLNELDIRSIDITQQYLASAEPGTVQRTVPPPGADFDPRSDTLHIIVSMELAVSEATPQQGPSQGPGGNIAFDPNITLDNDRGTSFRPFDPNISIR
jgi:hypothetical protein